MTTEITQADVDQSYRLTAFLRLCKATMADVCQSEGDAVTRRELDLKSSVELTLEVVLEIADHLHDKLELNEVERLQRQAKAVSEPEAEPCA